MFTIISRAIGVFGSSSLFPPASRSDLIQRRQMRICLQTDNAGYCAQKLTDFLDNGHLHKGFIQPAAAIIIRDNVAEVSSRRTV